MAGHNQRQNKSETGFGRILVGWVALASLPLWGGLVVIILFISVVIGAAGGILGWLFGGGAPSGQGDPNTAPQAEVQFWTPTPVPAGCFTKHPPVMITVPANTPADPPVTAWLPTPTPCPTPVNRW